MTIQDTSLFDCDCDQQDLIDGFDHDLQCPTYGFEPHINGEVEWDPFRGCYVPISTLATVLDFGWDEVVEGAPVEEPRVKDYDAAVKAANERGLTCTCGAKTVKDNHGQDCPVSSCAEWLEMLVDWGPTSKKFIRPAGSYDSTFGSFFEKCRHNQQEVTLPDGTVVHCSSAEQKPRQHIPDLGVYMDGIWTPDCVAYHVGWRDYGTPTMAMELVLRIAREALELARGGGFVELGCIGGHGRTGSMLAILWLLAMDEPDAAEAIKASREAYCSHGIESERQVVYLECVAAELNGQPWESILPTSALVKPSS